MKNRNMLCDGRSKAFDHAASVARVQETASAIQSRLSETDAAVSRLKAASQPPVECGPAIPAAPARGELKTFRPIELVPGSVGTARDTGHWERGEDQRRRGARIRDVFDRMHDQARAAHKARGDKAGPFVPPLTPAQVQIARDYRDLTERHAAGGMKCASLEAAGRGSGGQGGEFIDAFVAEGLRLDAFHRRIGTGVAMAVRRIRPSERGNRTGIRNRDLVDDICIRDMDPSAVLKRHGWSEKGKTRDAVRKALAAALDRMIGYDLHPMKKPLDR